MRTVYGQDGIVVCSGTGRAEMWPGTAQPRQTRVLALPGSGRSVVWHHKEHLHSDLSAQNKEGGTAVLWALRMGGGVFSRPPPPSGFSLADSRLFRG